MQAPPELESRLRNALDRVPNKKKKNEAVLWFGLSAAALVLIIGTYQYPALTYYGNKMFNMELNASSFSEASEEGYGQVVNKSTTLEDGTVITVERVIADDNAFTMHYSIDRPSGSVYSSGSFRYNVGNIQGFMTNSSTIGGGGNSSGDERQYEGVYSFEPISPFSRTLTVTFNEWLENGERVSYPISFKFDASKAMKSLVKEKISQSVSVDSGVMYFESITASPSSTLIKGHIRIDEKEKHWFFGKTQLYVNGMEMNPTRTQVQFNKTTGLSDFELRFDALPTDVISSIELLVKESSGYYKIPESISLASPSDQSIKVGNEKLWIRSVSKTDTGYDVVVASKQFTILDKDNILAEALGSQIPVSSISSGRPWDLGNGNVLWERTYSFNTSDRPETLHLNGYHYMKTYNKRVTIPIE